MARENGCPWDEDAYQYRMRQQFIIRERVVGGFGD